MAYVKQTWVDGQSPLSAERMNYIEEGIRKVSDSFDQYSATGGSVDVSAHEPTENHVKLWINQKENVDIVLPEVKDNVVSEDDTWSSAKIQRELDSKLGAVFSSEFANKLFYITEEGKVAMLTIGPGLKIENGVLTLEAIVLDSARLDSAVL